jgi:hypothetical protein
MTPNPDTAREDPSRPEPLSTAALAGAGEPRTREERSFEAEADTERGRDDVSTPMFPAEEAQELRSAWDSIQAGFVDEPRSAVESADELVARTMKRLAEGFAAERAALEEQWASGGDVSTEDLRQALRRYRAFFGRLLSV